MIDKLKERSDMKLVKLLRQCGILLVVMAGPAFACQGNACGDVKPSVSGNCHTLQNVGSRRIRIKWGDTFGPKDLGPGESWTIMNPFGGGCVGTIAGDIFANYI